LYRTVVHTLATGNSDRLVHQKQQKLMIKSQKQQLL